ncbi:MAG: hypothetical protein E6Q97_03740 [Desulfurellales bacterium]|nr:MAG: hypothetical protein E6Q97_03740 [Desulfurellales bacterium]
MAEGARYDSTFTESRQGQGLALPYESIGSGRSITDNDDNDHRLLGVVSSVSSGSQEVYVTSGNKIARRPVFNTNLFGEAAGTVISGKRIDRMWFYQTLPSSAGYVYSYILMSVYNFTTGFWEMYYRPNDGGSQIPTIFTDTRSCNSSTIPHICTFSRGLAYIKGFPDSSTSEKLGTIIFDGSGGTPAYKWWGLLGPTVPARIEGWVGKLDTTISATATSMTVSAVSAPPATPFTVQLETEQITVGAKAGAGPYTLSTLTRAANGTTAQEHQALVPVLHRSWAASAHKVEVKTGWQYGYAFKTNTGHISNRSPGETNPDLMPSNTLPFFNQIPDVTYEGNADTTNIPKIIFYRTADGGGNFMELEEFSNPGAGAQTYTDDSLGTGASSSTFSDPLPDTSLKPALLAPSLDSNSPPPTVNFPLVVGTDQPSTSTSNLETWQGRIWMAIDNMLYCSNNEETKAGIPEEAWEYGDNATFYKFTDKIVAIKATSHALYVLGASNTYIGTGTDKLSFAFNTISTTTPAISQDSACAFMDRVAFVTRDLRLCIITGETVDTVTEPIGSIPLVDSTDIKVTFYYSALYQWICVLVPRRSISAVGKMLIYDFGRSQREGRDFWFPPWHGPWNTFCIMPLTGNVVGSSLLVVAAHDVASVTKSSGLVTMAFDTSGADSSLTNAAWTTSDFEFSAMIGPYKNPAGNHLNKMAVPHTTSTLSYIKVDYVTPEVASVNIGMTVYYDMQTVATAASTGTSLTTQQSAPTRRAQSTGYHTKEWHPYQVVQDACIRIHRGSFAATSGVSIERVVVGFLPSAGPDSAGQGG